MAGKAGLFEKLFGHNKKQKKQTFDPQKWFDTEGTVGEMKDLSGRFCPNPFRQMDVYDSGQTFSCCSSWLRLPLGYVREDTPHDVWNSEQSQAIRQSIFDGSYKFCDHKICPFIQGNTLPTMEEARKNPAYAEIIDKQLTVLATGPTYINFCNDKSCNLSCPSCRTEKIMLSSGPLYEQKKAINQKLVDAYLSEPTDRAFSLNVTGSGDPFGSKIFREFLFDLDGSKFPNMDINLQTNGVMFTPRNFERLQRVHKNLGNLLISLDAATADTYAITRRGGDWDLLQENLAFLGKKRAEGFFKYMRLDFVVQVDNFEEMPAFVELAKSYGPDEIYFSMITDWNTWPKDVYESKCIWKESHPRFHEFLEVLKHPVFETPGVQLGNVTAFRELALKAA